MGKKKKLPVMMPFMVTVSVVLDYPLPIVAKDIEQAKEIAEKIVANGWASDYADEGEPNVDHAAPATEDEIKNYRFLNEEMDEHKI
jgi:hypothetical protein